MSSLRPLSGHALRLATALLVGLAGCERSAPESRVESIAPSSRQAPDSSAGAEPSTGWTDRDGIALLIQGESRSEAIVLLPVPNDTTPLRRLAGIPAVLLGRGGALFQATLGDAPSTRDSECRVWPLRDVHSDSGATAWAVGFAGARATPVAMDSIELLSSRDSMTLAAEASRLASAVTVENAPSFQGLRFTAHDIRRFEAAPGIQALVAHLIRRVNQEANPQEERTLLIAERDSGVTSGPYQLVYAERGHALEEQGVTPEVIAAMRIAGRTTLVVARDGDDGVAYALIERTGPRQWRVRWTSAPTRCA